jgi:D-sedoheptulose 7-phosphate isomerase
MDAQEIAHHYIRTLAQALYDLDYDQISKAADLLREARNHDRFVWIVGNGGSAATASHFANDLCKVGLVRAISIPDLTPVVTAYGNDGSWERMFSLPLEQYRSPGDVLVAISCSGNSPNVLYAADCFSQDSRIFLTGNKLNGLLRRPAAALIRAHAEDIRMQEDVHLAVCHCIAGLLREHV